MTDLIICDAVGYRQQGVDILADVDWRIERSGGRLWPIWGE